VTYCTVDVAPPGESRPAPTIATGNVSVPRKAGPLATVAYLHGTSVSFYDAPSNPSVAGQLEERGESFDGPPSSAIFAGAGFIDAAPDYLGLGDSTVPRHRSFHAATEASSSVDLLAASREVLRSLRVRRGDQLFTFGFSQGGHAALALQRALERRVEVTATAIVGAVLDGDPTPRSACTTARTTRKCSSTTCSCPWTGCGASPCGPCPASTTSTAGSRPCPGRRVMPAAAPSAPPEPGG
jgi:pimeloyl-ACP methyl ester carboxylesterase